MTYDAVIDVANGERLLKPSMTANVTAVYATREAALRVPNSALRFKPDAATIAAMTAGATRSAPEAKGDARVVWLRRGDRVEPAKVRVGISDGTVTEVLEGEAREGDDAILEANVAAAAAKGRGP